MSPNAKAIIPVNFRCACGTGATEAIGTTSAGIWTCPSCARRWQADPQALHAALLGANELRALRRDIAAVIAVTAVIAIILAVIHPPWLLGAPMLMGGVALLAQPSYRKRISRGKAALRTPIGVAAA